MSFQSDHILLLLRRFAESKATPAEMDELLAILADRSREDEYLPLYQQVVAEDTAGVRLPRFGDREEGWEEILVKLPELQQAPGLKKLPAARPVHRIHFLRKWWWAAAAVLLIGIATAIVVSTDRRLSHQNKEATAADVLPGTEKAILTLADGTNIALDSAGTGSLAQQGNAQIVKKEDGRIAYTIKGGPGAAMMNTLRTPRGGQYKLQLPDGSQVWLNAESSIYFPAAFTGNTREVSVTGELYFEIAKNKDQPFIVKTKTDKIMVLGTAFNINSYEDEGAVKTSLLQGSVKVGDTFIKPGQAFQDGKLYQTNVEQDIAWKNGYFSFDNVGIKEMARQIERWYDVKVQFEGQHTDIQLRGGMDRGVKLSGIIRFFNSYGLQTRLEGRNLYVKGN